MDYTIILDLGITFLESFLGKLSDKLPAEVVASIQAAIDAIDAHKDDVITQAALEAERG